MTAEELVARHVAARGGLERILAIRTLRQRGTVTSPQYVVHIYGERKRPDLLRIEFTMDGTTGMEGWDGQAAWEFNPWRGMGQAEYVTGLPALALQRGAEFDGPLVGYRERGHTVALVAAAGAAPGGYTLRVTRNDGNIIDHTLDAATLLVVQTRSVRPIHGSAPEETVTLYDDYRRVAGVLFPFRSQELARDGAHSELFQWEMMEANLPLADARFQIPPPGRVMSDE